MASIWKRNGGKIEMMRDISRAAGEGSQRGKRDVNMQRRNSKASVGHAAGRWEHLTGSAEAGPAEQHNRRDTTQKLPLLRPGRPRRLVRKVGLNQGSTPLAFYVASYLIRHRPHYRLTRRGSCQPRDEPLPQGRKALRPGDGREAVEEAGVLRAALVGCLPAGTTAHATESAQHGTRRHCTARRANRHTGTESSRGGGRRAPHMRVFTTSKGLFSVGPMQAATKPDVADCTGDSSLPSPSCSRYMVGGGRHGRSAAAHAQPG